MPIPFSDFYYLADLSAVFCPLGLLPFALGALVAALALVLRWTGRPLLALAALPPLLWAALLPSFFRSGVALEALLALAPFALLAIRGNPGTRVLEACRVVAGMIPDLGYLLPGCPQFPVETGVTSLAVPSADPLRGHAGMLCTATHLASIVLLSLPAAVGLMASALLPLGAAELASGASHLHYPRHTLPFALTLLCMFDRLGVRLAYTLAPCGGVNISISEAEMWVLQAHYYSTTREIHSLSLLTKLRSTQTNGQFKKGMSPGRGFYHILKYFPVVLYPEGVRSGV